MPLPEDDDDLGNFVPPEVFDADRAEVMTIFRSARRKTDENIYSEIETVQDWIQCIQETDSPVFKFVLLFQLPGVCQGKYLNNDEISKIVHEIPCEVISDLIMTDNPDVDLCLELTCTILEVFLPRNEADLSNLKQLQSGLNYNLINKNLESFLFQRMIICSVRLGIEGFSLDDAVSVLNQCLKLLISDTKEFPSVDMLHCVQQLIQRLISNPPRSIYLCLNATWSKDLTILIKRLLQTFKIDEKYYVLCFELCAATIDLLGTKWFSIGDNFPILLCSLAAGRLRIVLEDPQEIQISLLVPILSILEFFIDAIDDSNFFNDEDATKMSYHLKDAGSFLFEYISECQKCQKVIPKKIMLPIYKFLCTFLMSGGMELLNPNVVEHAIQPIIDVANDQIMKDDLSIAGMLLYNLPSFKKLPSTTLDFIVNYLLQAKNTPNFIGTALAQVVSILDQFKDRTDFFVDKDKERLANLAKNLNDTKLVEICKSF